MKPVTNRASKIIPFWKVEDPVDYSKCFAYFNTFMIERLWLESNRDYWRSNGMIFLLIPPRSCLSRAAIRSQYGITIQPSTPLNRSFCLYKLAVVCTGENRSC